MKMVELYMIPEREAIKIGLTINGEPLGELIKNP